MKQILKDCLAILVLWASLASLTAQSPAPESTATDSEIKPAQHPRSSFERLDNLMSMSLEDLLQSDVTSVSKHPERLRQAAAAVTVITGDEIRRSGARSIPEALRLAPGISVAQVDASKWAVASRGLNDLFTDRLLVLVDGRSAYSHIFSGVYWNVQDVVLEDIERIEVIRGPGGTLWGANAVNGVINIITKDAKDTQGYYVTGGAGFQERAFGTFRYGTAVGENGYVRGYIKGFNRADSPGGIDSWRSYQGGFRSDWEWPDTHLTFQGDIYEQDTQSLFYRASNPAPFALVVAPEPLSADYTGGNALVRLEHGLGIDSSVQVQAYYSGFRERRLTRQSEDDLDLEAQHRFAIGEWNSAIYGLGYRFVSTNPRDNDYWNYQPNARNQNLYSGFVQDEIDIVKDRLKLILGTKIEHNDYTGWEVQPNARLSLAITDRQTIWGAVSRAVQTPSRANRDLTIPILPVPNFPPLGGTNNPAVQSQDLLAFELGYRIQPVDNLSFDIATFFNEHRNAFDSTFVAFDASRGIIYLTSGNGADFDAYGFEISGDWRPTDWWRLVANYSFLQLDLVKGTPARNFGADPQQQIGLRSSWDLPYNMSFDAWFRWVDELTVGLDNVDSYFDLDLRLGWQPSKNWEIALVGQNLVDPQRLEFGESLVVRTQVTPAARGAYFQVTYRY